MNLRCSPGCLAIVIYDTEPCVANIGRIVRVRGPLRVNPELGLPCWLIRPVDPAPFAVEYANGVRVYRVTWKSQTEHPDAWLLPLSVKGDLADEIIATKRSSAQTAVGQSFGKSAWTKEAGIMDLLVHQMELRDRPPSPELGAKQLRLLKILASLESSPQQADASDSDSSGSPSPGSHSGSTIPSKKRRQGLNH